ncbi:flagellar hook associated protein [Peteryoungia desertarenae]|uniref:Flagellin n=1 Tax=Peteryoungia desertarenae TaxID=1813451 RepID=A0ABX6QRU6_9HYPH|nr:flagellin [Peteryoungia desertarenae]QLF70987.1 flagellar hook associated protein [Peteryoungia desertarenae]
MTAINATAASALSLLTGSNRALENTTTRVASGREVNKAADNAAYWSIATTMNSSNLQLSTAEDASGLAAAITDTAALGMEKATAIVSDIQSKLIMARSPGVDRRAVNEEITQLKQQLTTVIDSSSFNGQNWLKAEAGQTPKVESMVAGVTSDGQGSIEINVIDFDTAKSTLASGENAEDGILTRSNAGMTRSGSAYDYYLLDANSSVPVNPGSRPIEISETTTTDEIDGMISALNSVMVDMIDAGADLGSTRNRISDNQSFLQDLQDTTTIGIGRLVDANMQEEAVKKAAQTVQQQLQTIGLNIANGTMGQSLALFR